MTAEEIRTHVQSNRNRHLRRLRDGLRASFVTLGLFQDWVAEQLNTLGGSSEEFVVQERALHDQPAYQQTLGDTHDDDRDRDGNEERDGIRIGPNLVADFFDGTGSLLLFAHADKDPQTFRYLDAGCLHESDDRLTAPGVADDVSGITAMLSAIGTIQEAGYEPVHTLRVASVLGKQCGVAGTYSLVRQYDATDGAVYVHPAESGGGLSDLKIASNGVYEFEVTIHSVPPETSEPHHTLFARAATDPVGIVCQLCQHLREWADDLDRRYTHRSVEALAGRSVGLLFGDVDTGGTASFQVPESSTLSGVVSFPPGVDLATVRRDFQDTVSTFLQNEGGLQPERYTITRGDIVTESAQVESDTPLVAATRTIVASLTDRTPSTYYGHTASDIRYPLLYWGTPTLGIGPEAGAIGTPEEWIDKGEYLETIATLVGLITEGGWRE